MISPLPSIDDLSGQRLMVGFNGTSINKDLEFLIGELRVGGLILFARNIKSPEQIKALCKSAQQFAEACRLPPLFIAIDQEGGQVARLRKPLFKEFAGNPSITDKKEAETFAAECAEALVQLRINMNFAPVMDVVPPNYNSIMKERAFCGSPAVVAMLGCTIINTLQAKGIMAVAKHFPGIGRTQLDSHLELPVLDAAFEMIETSDLIPFKEACGKGVAGIMLSHILYKKIDPDWPASLSPKIAKTLLRKNLGFQGLVMTDDLDMNAVTYNIETCVKQIMEAEVDLALICHKGPDIQKAQREIKRLLSANETLYKKGIKSWGRIVEAKGNLT